jgi:CRP/FNR family cyclic AMP-dependent transcriptional regulator
MTRKTTSAAKMALLGQIDLFAECTKKELAQIASITTEYDAEAGQVLAQEGRPGGEFFIIVDGQATASRNNVVLAKLSCTDFFGELALLDGGSRTATVTADTDMHLLILSRGEFGQLCRAYPTVSYRMLKGLGGRLRQADEMIVATGDPDFSGHVTV